MPAMFKGSAVVSEKQLRTIRCDFRGVGYAVNCGGVVTCYLKDLQLAARPHQRFSPSNTVNRCTPRV